jgi:hypothetical protein
MSNKINQMSRMISAIEHHYPSRDDEDNSSNADDESVNEHAEEPPANLEARRNVTKFADA